MAQTNTSRLAQIFLQEMKSNDSFEKLDTLIESLESKNDPEPVELHLLETLYQFQEKLKITESKLNSYIIKSRENTPGNKLDSLYNHSRSFGSSILFED